jgi:beta-glucosidase-like glycosyl hydrolase
MEAVESGRITMEMIDDRVSRILALKKELLQKRGTLLLP